MANYLFTSESVSEGHPDKIADQISDALLDAFLTQDKNSRVACETFITTGMVIIGGEVSTKAHVEPTNIIRKVISQIGYNHSDYMFEAQSCGILSTIHSQSPDIGRGVDKRKAKDKFDSIGAGDQGMMFGYACRETPELMPAALMFSHRIVKKLADIRKAQKHMPYLRPDAKSQITLEYENSEIVRVNSVVVSTQHDKEPKEFTEAKWQQQLREDVISMVINKIIPSHLIDKKTKFHVNPTGRFEIGGPHGDAGLTGRKIIVDTYGGAAPHGGGAFSGKDPSKVDRSAAYASRHIAKNIVASGLAAKCTVQVSYVIGIVRPVSIYINTHNTAAPGITDRRLTEVVQRLFDLRPAAIIDYFELTKCKGWCYQDTAAYGHFGRDVFPWEKINRIKELQRAV